MGPSEELAVVIVLDADDCSVARASCRRGIGELAECIADGSRAVEHHDDHDVCSAVNFFDHDHDGQWSRSVDDLHDVDDRGDVDWCFAGLSRCMVLA